RNKVVGWAKRLENCFHLIRIVSTRWIIQAKRGVFVPRLKERQIEGAYERPRTSRPIHEVDEGWARCEKLLMVAGKHVNLWWAAGEKGEHVAIYSVGESNKLGAFCWSKPQIAILPEIGR